MKYKILLTGNNKTIIDDLFVKSSEHFEYQNTSARYEDIICHMRYFQPDAFLYCLNHDVPESFLKMADVKKAPETGKTAFFSIGTRAECDAYTRTVPGVVDLVMEKPMTISVMEDKMESYFISLITPPISAPGVTSPAAAQPATAQPTAAQPASPAPAASQPQTGNPAPAQPQTQGSSPAASAQPQTQGSSPAASAQPQAQGSSPAASAQPQAQGSSPAASAQPQTQGGSPAVSAQPQVQGSSPVTPAQPQAAPAPQPETGSNQTPTMPNFSEDPNDALLLALTEHVDTTAKMIDSMSGMPSMHTDSDSEDDPKRRRHVLVVDDDSRMLKIIKRHLADKYDVATALNGRLALKFLETKRTDLILLDYEMPLENGPTILKKLRENPFTHDIPVIFLTGISERDKIEKALVMKPQGYLLKPIDHIKLLSTISKFIG